MMSEKEFLSSEISVSRRFQRSIKLDSDLDSRFALDGFILQDSNEECLSMMAKYVLETPQRAFTWTGSYGSGKSALALFLCSLLGADLQLQKKAAKILKHHSQNAKEIQKAFLPTEPYKIITLIGHNGQLATDFINAVYPQAKDAREAIAWVVKQAQVNPSSGVCIVIDELGKYLEGGNADNCYFLQELAESVNRANAPILVLGILHQAFDAYAHRLTKAQRDEWAKVQGRYVDIPLLSAADEVLRLLDECICQKTKSRDNDFLAAVDSIVGELAKSRKIDRYSYDRSLKGVFPLNPVSACLLGSITRQSFLQNTRSVFNFLTSREPFGFNAFLQSTPVHSASGLYSPDYLWDYLQTNFEHAIRATESKSHRWAMACDCLERADRLGLPLASRIVKIIAVLDLFKSGTGLEPSFAVITAALCPVDEKSVQDALNLLIEQRVIIYRKYLNAFTLFEGSDFNLDEQINEALTHIEALDVDSIRQSLELPPVIARRYYAQYGTMRWFSRELCNYNELKVYLKKKPVDSRAAGRLILAFTDQDPEEINISQTISELNPCIFIGLVGEKSDLVEAGREMMALDLVSKNPALEGDAVARQELTLRREAVESLLVTKLKEIYEHMSWNSSSIAQFTVASPASLNSMLSTVCEKIYFAAPKINNELINREQLSSNIIHAVKQLVNRMVFHAHEKDLGFEEDTFPPEKMIYRSILRNSSIHRYNNTRGNWEFSSFSHDSSNKYDELWKGTLNFFKDHEKPSLAELYQFWSKEPFGIKSGVCPVLAMAYFLANSNALSIYLKEAFEPDLNEEILLTWFNDPSAIKFRYVPSDTARNELLDRLYEGLLPLVDEIANKSPLSIARAIVRIVLTCPKWALSTSQLSERSKQFRNAVIKAWDPLELIFKELPRVFATNDIEQIVAQTLIALKEIQEVTPQMLDKVRAILLKALDAQDNPDGIRERAAAIRGLAGQIKLEAFVTRLSVYRENYASIEGIISLAVSKPKAQWTDRDIELCISKLNEWALTFRHLESMGSLINRPCARRMISIVVGGEHGQSHALLDLPVTSTASVQKATNQLSQLLSQYPKEVALAALIEHSQELLNKDQ